MCKENHHEIIGIHPDTTTEVKPLHRYFLRRCKAWQESDRNLVSVFIWENQSAFSDHSMREKGGGERSNYHTLKRTDNLTNAHSSKCHSSISSTVCMISHKSPCCTAYPVSPICSIGLQCWPRDTLYSQKLALTSPTSGGRLIGIVRLRTKATEFSLVLIHVSFLILKTVGRTPMTGDQPVLRPLPTEDNINTE
jgi:hypothetical protein